MFRRLRRIKNRRKPSKKHISMVVLGLGLIGGIVLYKKYKAFCDGNYYDY